MIAIVNYGLGNVQAFANIYSRLNLMAAIVDKPEKLKAAKKIILPGVGSFDGAMSRLNNSGLRNTLEELVMQENIPILGVCVGMQMMCARSEEGQLPGLGWIDGEVKCFETETFTQRTHLPHMGWNDILIQRNHPLLKNLESGSRFYFLHSYYFVPKQPDHILAKSDYNGFFTCGIGRNNVFGVQFHPEKSHQWGIQLLKNFAEI